MSALGATSRAVDGKSWARWPGGGELAIVVQTRRESRYVVCLQQWSASDSHFEDSFR